MTYSARITDQWLPFPEAVLRETGWRDGDEIQVEVIDDVIVLTKIGDATRVTVRAKPKKGAGL